MWADEEETPCVLTLGEKGGAGVSVHSHRFVEEYGGFIGFGFDRETDESTVWVYLQKFSDDELMKAILKRMSNEDLQKIFELVGGLLKKYLSDQEYHRLFLKEQKVEL